MNPAAHITVKGQGDVTVTPDQVVIHLKARGFAWQYSESLADLNQNVEKLRQVLEGLGLDRKQLKTRDLSVDAMMVSEASTFPGIEAEDIHASDSVEVVWTLI